MSYTNGLDDPTLYFNTITYTGDGTSSRSITGVGFQPDWVWTKKRNGATGHRLVDSVRGVTKALFTNGTNVETTESNGLTAFASDGYTLGDNTNYNANSDTYVAWNWLAGGTASSNTDGSITSTVSANTTSGFSICTYTGNSGNPSNFGHGLGVAPSMVLIKNRDYSGDPTGFLVYHKSNGANYSLTLHTTNAKSLNTISFGNTTPSSSVVYVGDDGGNYGTNLNTHTYVAYCFAEKKGFSKFGSYTGNANDNGTFSYTGFKPAWVMIKRTDVIKNWYLIDNKRENYNPNHETTILFANSSNAEQTLPDREVDFLSNGFKLRGSDGDVNASGGTYIYMAFAENPFTTSTGIPTTAR